MDILEYPSKVELGFSRKSKLHFSCRKGYTDCKGPSKYFLGPGGGGGHCLFVGRYPKQNYRPPVLCYHSPLSVSLLVYSSLFLRHQRKAYCYFCCYRGLPPVDIIFSCPDTITLITVAKTLIIANPGCFPWTSQANNYSPNRKCPSDSPPPESSWVRDSPPFSILQPQLRESVLQWVPKTRVSAPPGF